MIATAATTLPVSSPFQAAATAVPPRPRPLQAVVIEFEGVDGPSTSNVRLWTEADAAACRLCRVCKAEDGPPGLDRDGIPARLRICSHTFLGLLDPDDDDSAAFFSPDGLR